MTSASPNYSDPINTAEHDQVGLDPQPFAPSVFRTRVVPSVALLMVLGLLGLLAYSLFAPDDARLGQQGRINSAGALVLEDGGPAPDFTIETFDGGSVTLSDLRGKIVILNFWASWCPPCRDETPLLVTASGNLGDDVALVGVNIWDAEPDAREFLEEFRVDYINGRDDDGSVAIDYGVSGVPETFVIDAAGNMVAKLPGPITTLEQLRVMVAEAR